MGIKVIIANNDDILFNNLSDILMQNELKIELMNVPKNKLKEFICQIKPNEQLIIIDSTTSVRFFTNFMKNALNSQTKKINIVILVIDSNITTNIVATESNFFFLRRKQSNSSILQIIQLISDTLKDSMEIDKNIDTLLWKLGFTNYFKGSIYLKDSIQIAYNDRTLLLDTQTLLKQVAAKNNVLNDKAVRSDIDRLLNNVLDNIDISILYDIFKEDYDGRKISLKYFIDLSIRYLEKQTCYLNY